MQPSLYNSAIGFSDLSPALQNEVKDLQKRMTVELEPLVLESTLTMQKILEAKDHAERVNLLRFFIDAERKRLEARKVLQGMFTDDSAEDIDIPDVKPAKAEEKMDESANKKDDAFGSGTIFMDDDAFQ